MWSQRQLLAAIWVLGTEPGYSGRAAVSTLNPLSHLSGSPRVITVTSLPKTLQRHSNTNSMVLTQKQMQNPMERNRGLQKEKPTGWLNDLTRKPGIHTEKELSLQ